MKKYLLLIGFLFISASAFTQDHSALIQKADSLVTEFFSEHKLPGMSISVYKDDSMIWSKGYGFADVENDTLLIDVNDVEKKIDELVSKIDLSNKPLVSLTVTNVEDFNQIRPKIEQLQENVLELSYSTKSKDEQYPILIDESETIDESFKRLAIENVGPELAKMAFEKLYPLLNEDKKEIKEIIMKNFEDFKAGRKT